MEVAWRKLMALKSDLISKAYPLKQRLRPFNAVITPAALYGCPAWTLTASQEQQLQRTERRMLRMICGTPRRKEAASPSTTDDLEPWVAWIKRATAEADRGMSSLQIEGWVQQYRRQKWKWAGNLVRNGGAKWSFRAMLWMPTLRTPSHSMGRLLYTIHTAHTYSPILAKRSSKSRSLECP